MKKIIIAIALIAAPVFALASGRVAPAAATEVCLSCMPPGARCTADSQCCSGFCDLFRIRWGVCQ